MAQQFEELLLRRKPGESSTPALLSPSDNGVPQNLTELLMSSSEIEEQVDRERAATSEAADAFTNEQKRFSTFDQGEAPKADPTGNAILDAFIKGTLAKSPERIETFEEFFDKRAPATYMLSDAWRGMFDSILGRETRSTRDRLFKEFQVETAAKQKQAELNAQNQRTALTLAAAQVRQESNNEAAKERNDANLGIDRDRLEAQKDQFLQTYGIRQDQLDVTKGQLELAERKFAALNERAPDKLLDAGRYMADQFFGELPEDASPEQRAERMKQVVEFGNVLDQQRQKNKLLGQREPRPPSQSFRFQKIMDGFGKTKFISLDPRTGNGFDETGKPMTSLEVKTFTPAKLKTLDAADKAISDFSVLTDFAANPANEEFFSPAFAAKTKIPAIIADTLGITNAQERTFDSLRRQLTLNLTRAATGAQATDRERNFIEGQLPGFADRLQTAQVLGFRANMLRAVTLRERLGLSVNDLPLEQVAADVLTTMAENPEVVMSGADMLAIAAQVAGREDVLEELENRGITF